ncbi:hypothetical protein [Streptomyces spiramenti]|uniref:PE-PGRS family protein n=1 Tax=Streptomyces spiramenti TaxID=2720606 RepID=A0ABX1AQ48_9ACTN|nr:hypothetical protein [Streptomyces spiramenti]NJP66572.1 hypothetical protein [Streptomyces spiramenti]
MSTDFETGGQLYSIAARAPWRERLAQRWSGRRDRALVLRDRDGEYHLAGRRNRVLSATTKLSMDLGIADDDHEQSPPGRRRYDSAFHVRLDERTGSVPISLPGPYEREPHDVHVRWWVHDPVEVLRARTSEGWPLVRRDVSRLVSQIFERHRSVGRRVTPAEMLAELAEPRHLPGTGLLHHAVDVRERDEEREVRLGAADDPGPPESWADIDKEAYAFCVRAVQDGPVSLAALWLVRHPDQVSDVLNWSVGHADLLRGETTWQDEMAGLLGTLSIEEREELSELVRDRLTALGRKVPGRPTGTVPSGTTTAPRPGGPGAESGSRRAPYPAMPGARPNGWDPRTVRGGGR